MNSVRRAPPDVDQNKCLARSATRAHQELGCTLSVKKKFDVGCSHHGMSPTCAKIGSEAFRIKYFCPLSTTPEQLVSGENKLEAVHPNPTFADRKLSHPILSTVKTKTLRVRNRSGNIKHEGLLAICGT